MISNEQRAHDLAMYYLDAVKIEKSSKAGESGETPLKFDAYKEYLILYSNLLEVINRDFSDNK